ncbi:hypothetical protein [Amycolatopsis sp. FDAARGOS 1241]|uniref:hypothetical protein n=1 Tax=Amycolatopsis sp. FDAARGOS 1241 TaxID=2778070 RepID=UPI00351C3360
MIQLGEVEVTKVVEWSGDIAPVGSVLPDTPPRLWRDNEHWLAPHHWHPAADAYHAAVQTWVLRSEGKVVLVDTGVGNDRDRPQLPLFDHLATEFLARLAAAGVRPRRCRRRGQHTSATTTAAGTPAPTAKAGSRPSPTPPT